MCIHYGDYLIQKLGDREELLGADVIVPHRMLKNHVIEQTAIKSYALFSNVAAGQLNLPEYCEYLIPHVETYEHIGEVPMCVHDLHQVWERAQAKRRKFVGPEEAWVKYEGEFPFPPALIWEYLTTPRLEAGVFGYDYAERADSFGGRVGEEAQFHCAHGDLHVYSKVVDWKPFEYYTLIQSVNSLDYLHTRRLIPTETGSRLCVYASKPLQDVPEEVRKFVQTEYDRCYGNLEAYIRRDLEKGKVSVT
jgi:uncharacterized protein YndB with AHSA1/START domain